MSDPISCPTCEAMRERFRAFVQAKAKQERYWQDDSGTPWSEVTARMALDHAEATTERLQARCALYKRLIDGYERESLKLAEAVLAR